MAYNNSRCTVVVVCFEYNVVVLPLRLCPLSLSCNIFSCRWEISSTTEPSAYRSQHPTMLLPLYQTRRHGLTFFLLLLCLS